MKSPKEIKDGNRICHMDNDCGKRCPYHKCEDEECISNLALDTVEYIEQLEERIAIMTEGKGETDNG